MNDPFLSSSVMNDSFMTSEDSGHRTQSASAMASANCAAYSRA